MNKNKKKMGIFEKESIVMMMMFIVIIVIGLLTALIIPRVLSR